MTQSKESRKLNGMKGAMELMRKNNIKLNEQLDIADQAVTSREEVIGKLSRQVIELENKLVKFTDAETNSQLSSSARQANSRQIGGNHYKSLPIQPWDFINANKLGFMEGTIISYLSRWQRKNGVEDLMKCKHYLDKMIEDWNRKEKAQEQVREMSNDFLNQANSIGDKVSRNGVPTGA